MTLTGICHRLGRWHDLYPNPSGRPDQNAAARRAEDEWLAKFADLDGLDIEQAAELVRWKFQSMPHRRVQAMKGIHPGRWESRGGRPGAGELIRSALAADDDFEALNLMARPGGGIYRFGPAMGSVVVAACRPETFTIADTRALKTIRVLGLLPGGPPQFRMSDWLPYLAACRELAEHCRLSLREVDRALWIAASDPGLRPEQTVSG